MRKSLKSTTALVMSAALAVPLPLVAQGQSNPQGLTLCGNPAEPPCLTDDGAKLMKAPGQAKKLEACETDGTLPCTTAEGFVKTEVQGDDTEIVQIEEAAAEDDTALANEDEAPDTDKITATDDADTAEIAAEAAPETLDETVAEASDEAVESAAVEGTGPVGVEEDTEGLREEAEVADTAETEEVEPKVVEAPATNETANEETIAAGDAVEAEVEANEVEVAEEPTIVEDEAAPVAAATLEDDTSTDTAEVETVEITEDTARSASEDFETSVTGNDSVASAESDDDGLSNFEKALLLGLGAVAVGSILDNGDEVVANSGDRVVVQRNGELIVLKDDDALLRQPGSEVRTETFNDGSTRTTVIREDGTQIVTIRAADGRVLRRSRVLEDGSQIVLFDDTEVADPVDVATLQETEPQTIQVRDADTEALRRALEAAMVRDTGRTFSLRQIRQIPEVRALAPEIELDTITFATGSAAIQPSQAEELADLGRAMLDVIEARPGEVFLIEGHTDAVGDATYNLALSDRRAETVALALTEYFDVPPENMVTQGYGESELKVQTVEAERANRRATVRVITPLLSRAN